MKVSELFEAGRVHTRAQNEKPAPRGEPEVKARVFDKKGEKNRSVIKKMYGERNQFFATGDTEIDPPDDEMSLPYHPGIRVLVMSGGETEDPHKPWIAQRSRGGYQGISVFFPWEGGEPDGHTFDDRAEEEWEKSKAKILKVAREEARERMTRFFSAVDNLIDSDSESPHMKAMKEKVAARAKIKVNKMLGSD